MKTRFIVTLMVASLVAVSGLALAGNQNGPGGFEGGQNGNQNGAGNHYYGGGPSTADRLARISNALGLSAEQEAALLEVLQQHELDRAAIREEMMVLMGPEICGLQADVEADILALLTEEQAALFIEHKAERGANANKGRNQRGFGPIDCTAYETD